MWVWQLSKLFIGMFLLKEKPEDIPYSKFLLGLLLVCAFSLKNATNLGFVQLLQLKHSTFKRYINDIF